MRRLTSTQGATHLKKEDSREDKISRAIKLISFIEFISLLILCDKLKGIRLIFMVLV